MYRQRFKDWLHRRRKRRAKKNVQKSLEHINKSDSQAMRRLRNYSAALQREIEGQKGRIAELEQGHASLGSEIEQKDHEIDRLERLLKLAKLENDELSGVVARDRARVEAEMSRFVRAAEGIDRNYGATEEYAQ